MKRRRLDSFVDIVIDVDEISFDFGVCLWEKDMVGMYGQWIFSIMVIFVVPGRKG